MSLSGGWQCATIDFFCTFAVQLERKMAKKTAKKVLFITQEIIPYVPETVMSVAGRKLPQAVQEQGCEIRTFMPRWGGINERRNQLHEVIRLSGMNLIIDDTDHPLIIKVASIPAARMQVYFIDNDDYFHRRKMLCDDKGEEYADNAERAVFFARGVLETVKKLRWCPDIIHCHGWISALAPLYIKSAYREDPPFVNAKVVFSAYNEMPQTAPQANFADCVKFREADAELLKSAGVDLTQPDALARLALAFSDGYVPGEAGADAALMALAQERGLPTMDCVVPGEAGAGEALVDFYGKVAGDEE